MNVWLCHSNFSFLQAASHPAELVATAKEKNIKTLAITDFDGFYGIVRAYGARKTLQKDSEQSNSHIDSQNKALHNFENQNQENQIPQLAYGAEILFHIPHIEGLSFPNIASKIETFQTVGSANSRSEKPLFGTAKLCLGGHESPPQYQDRICFLAKNIAGYQSLCTLIKYAHRNGKISTPLDLSDPHIPWPNNTIAIVPCRGRSQLFQSAKSINSWNLFILNFISHFLQNCEKQNSFFLALTPPTCAPERNAFERHIHFLQQHPQIQPLLTDDVFFHNVQRKELHNILLSIKQNETLESYKWAFFANAERKLKSENELQFFLKPWKNKFPELIRQAEQNNKTLKCEFCLSELKYQYPSEFIPEGFTSFTYLQHLVQISLEKKYSGNTPKRVQKLVEREYELILDLNFADYFLTVWDIVRFAREQNILCQGRGSSANSVVCYLLEITAVDPMVSDVLFERFISRERGEPPDIDVDFEHERREEVIQYIYNRYGTNRAAMVANVIVFQKRGSLRSVGKALGFHDSQISALMSTMVDRQSSKLPEAQLIAEGLERVSFRIQDKNLALPENLKKWSQFAKELRGFPRHMGIHSGGFVVCQHSLSEFCPSEPATMTNRTVVQWNKDDLETLGLFKIDVLALGMLTALRKCLQYLEAKHTRVSGTQVPLNSLQSIPPECPATFDMICEARTIGVFQIESRAQMQMLPKVQPRSFYDIAVQIGIVRPGPITAGMAPVFVRRKLGLEKVVYPDKRLEEILARTMGVPIFQEQVMRVAIVIGNFTPGEADELRRSMGAWKMTGKVHAFQEKLMQGMKQNGIPDEFALQIYKHIEGFSQYGFPESHAMSFAHITYASCYLKAHYPAAFLTALLNSQPLGFYSSHSLIQNALHEGVVVKPVSILHSTWNHQLLADNTVLLGFRQISHLQEEHVNEFEEKRSEVLKSQKIPLKYSHVVPQKSSISATVNISVANEFNSKMFEQILHLCEIFTPSEKTALAMADTFHTYDSNRRNILWHLLSTPSRMFSDIENIHFASSGFAEGRAEEQWDDLEDDFEHLHTTLGPHPMALLKQHFWPCSVPVEKFTPSIKLQSRRNGENIFVCGFVIVRQSPPTAKGMTFLSLEDEVGLINVIVQPAIYEAYRTLITGNSLVCCRGTLQLGHLQSEHGIAQGSRQEKAQTFAKNSTPTSAHSSIIAREFFALALSQKWKQEYPTVESKLEDIPTSTNTED